MLIASHSGSSHSSQLNPPRLHENYFKLGTQEQLWVEIAYTGPLEKIATKKL